MVGPKDFTNTFEIFDFRVGGTWRFVMHGPDGSNDSNGCVFVELQAEKKLVIQHVSQPHFTLSVSLCLAKQLLKSCGFKSLKIQMLRQPFALLLSPPMNKTLTA